jgi:hypothetical protein
MTRGGGQKIDFFKSIFFKVFVVVYSFLVVGKSKKALKTRTNAPNTQAMRLFIIHFFLASMLSGA